MSSTSRGGSATASSTTASPTAQSEGTLAAGGTYIKMDGDADAEGSIEEGKGEGRVEGDDTQDPDFVELPVGYTPHLPSSSEPPSLQNRPRRLVWVVRSGLHVLREVRSDGFGLQ